MRPSYRSIIIGGLSVSLLAGLCLHFFSWGNSEQFKPQTQASTTPPSDPMLPTAAELRRRSHQLATSSARPQQQSDPHEGIPDRVRLWMRLPLTPQTFADGIALLRDRNIPELARLLVLDKMHSWRRRLAPDEIKRLFAETDRIAGDATEPVALRSRAVSAIATLLVVMQEQSIATQASVDAHLPFLTQLAQDEKTALAVRGRAIRALGILKAEAAGAVLKALLAVPENVNEPELARNCCLALAQIEGNSAVGPIGRVLSTTTDESIFGTAAFALGQIHTPDSLVPLIQNEDRFSNSGSSDAILVDMGDLIQGIFQDPANPNVVFAIKATKHLWKDGQLEQIAPVLHTLLTAAPLVAEKAAAERLIEIARALPLEKEQEQLAAILPAISSNPALGDYAQQIQDRLNAKPLVPNAPPIPTVSRPR